MGLEYSGKTTNYDNVYRFFYEETGYNVVFIVIAMYNWKQDEWKTNKQKKLKQKTTTTTSQTCI